MMNAGEPFSLTIEDADEPEPYEILDEIQNRQNNLNEKIISLKAITETLKNLIQSEKYLWTQEIKETVQLEKKLKEKQESMHSMTSMQEDEYKRKLEIFRDFLFFSQTSEKLSEIAKKNNYQQWLADLNDECSLELDKITQSLTALKPLQNMVSKWNVQSETDSGISDIKKIDDDHSRSDYHIEILESDDAYECIFS